MRLNCFCSVGMVVNDFFSDVLNVLEILGFWLLWRDI